MNIKYTLQNADKAIDLIKEYETTLINESLEINNFDKINIDWEAVRDLGEAGLLKIIIAHSDNVILGFQILSLSIDIIQKDYVVATSLILYVNQSYRGRFTIDFIKECDILLKGIGVNKVLHHYTNKRIITLFRKLGYQEQSKTLVNKFEE